MEMNKYMFSKKKIKDSERNKFFNGILPVRYLFRSLVKLPTEDFVKRLAKTDIGEKIKESAETEIDEAVDAISLSYDEFGKVATDLFQRRAQIISLIAGLIVAFSLNVNGLVILRSYLDDPVLTAEVVDQADDLKERFELSMAEAGSSKAIRNGREIVVATEELQKSLEGLSASRLSFGYSSDATPNKPGTGDWEKCFWVLCVLATGLLIGLGGPFWYNIVNKLMDILRVVRGGSPKPTKQVKPGEAVTAEPDLMHELRDVFKKTGQMPPQIRAQVDLDNATAAAASVSNLVDAARAELKEHRVALSRASDKAKPAVVNKVNSARGVLYDALKAQAKILRTKKEKSSALVNSLASTAESRVPIASVLGN